MRASALVLLLAWCGGCAAPSYEALARTQAELEAEIEELFRWLDLDGDGRLVAEELVGAFAELLEGADRDGDGALTRGELAAEIGPALVSASFTAVGTDLRMIGVIDSRTPRRLAAALRDHPGTERLVLARVDGSIDHEATAAAGRLVRARSLETHVPAGGVVASGGVDLFLAGVRRTAGEDAAFGVHSWVLELLDLPIEGRDLPRDHPAHAEQLAFLRDLGIHDDFYWFTLEVAGADDIHWLGPDELARFSILHPKAPPSPSLD